MEGVAAYECVAKRSSRTDSGTWGIPPDFFQRASASCPSFSRNTDGLTGNEDAGYPAARRYADPGAHCFPEGLDQHDPSSCQE